MLDSLREKLNLEKGHPQAEEQAAPPAYNEPHESPHSLVSPLNNDIPDCSSIPQDYTTSQHANLQLQAPPGFFRFPQSFGIYHAPGSLSDLLIAQHTEDPNPIYLITAHSGLSSQPSVVLHSAASENAQPLATADFHSFSSSADIMLYVPNPSQPAVLSMHKEGILHSSHVFSVYTPSVQTVEAFEWKTSSGAEVDSLDGRAHGKKCVRIGTGEVVAAWAKPDLSYNKKGKMMFLSPNRGALGEQFEVMAVITIASIMEQDRRRQRNVQNKPGGVGGFGPGQL
jgi:hypothetical protein